MTAQAPQRKNRRDYLEPLTSPHARTACVQDSRTTTRSPREERTPEIEKVSSNVTQAHPGNSTAPPTEGRREGYRSKPPRPRSRTRRRIRVALPQGDGLLAAPPPVPGRVHPADAVAPACDARRFLVRSRIRGRRRDGRSVDSTAADTFLILHLVRVLGGEVVPSRTDRAATEVGNRRTIGHRRGFRVDRDGD